jgi:hypothetical protein
MTPVTIAFAMAVVSWWLLSPPRSAHDVADVITVCFAAALTLGAYAILIRWLWRAWRRFRHDA